MCPLLTLVIYFWYLPATSHGLICLAERPIREISLISGCQFDMFNQLKRRSQELTGAQDVGHNKPRAIEAQLICFLFQGSQRVSLKK